MFFYFRVHSLRGGHLQAREQIRKHSEAHPESSQATTKLQQLRYTKIILKQVNVNGGLRFVYKTFARHRVRLNTGDIFCSPISRCSKTWQTSTAHAVMNFYFSLPRPPELHAHFYNLYFYITSSYSATESLEFRESAGVTNNSPIAYTVPSSRRHPVWWRDVTTAICTLSENDSVWMVPCIKLRSFSCELFESISEVKHRYALSILRCVSCSFLI